MNRSGIPMRRFIAAVNDFNRDHAAYGRAEVTTWKDYVKSRGAGSYIPTSAQAAADVGADFVPRDDQRVLDYDFDGDDMTDEERNEFSDALFALLGRAKSLGSVYDFDGSGDGLYYGILVFE